MKAPIVLFTYNRPEHTNQTLKALVQNVGANESELYIYCDGPKVNASEEQLAKIAAVRSIAHEYTTLGLFQEVFIIEAPTNKGLARSIREGVTEVLAKHGRVIVLEDDIYTSPAFLSYMNQSLDFYATRKAVFSIGAYTYPPTKMQIPADYPFDTYVCLRNCSWGWATWQDRWEQVDWNAMHYAEMKNHLALQQAFNRMGDDVFEMLQHQQEGKLDVWSILFTLAHFENHAVAICPCQSYVNNVGLDGSGSNCGVHDALQNNVLCKNMQPRMVDVLYEDTRVINAFYNVNCRTKRPIWQKACNFVARKLGIKPLFVIKKKVYAD